MNLSVPALVAEQARTRPDAVALEDGERTLTYAELDAVGGAVAATLLEAGLGREEAVGVCLPRSWRAACAYLGIMRAGCAYVPVPPEHPRRRRRMLLELAGAGTTLTAGEGGDPLGEGLRTIDVDGAMKNGGEAPDPPPGGDRLAYILFTSGSTGTPKGVEITHRNLVNQVRGRSAMVPGPSDAMLHASPLGFDLSAFELWSSFTNGARLIVGPAGRPDPREIGRLISARGVTITMFSAGLLAQLVRVALADLGGMRTLSSGGDVFLPATAAELRAAHPELEILNSYGPTETTIIATEHILVGEPDGGPIPIGRALSGYTTHVLDQNGEPVPPGTPGELWIGGTGVARGYRNDPERTAECFREIPGERGIAYRSGDLVREREDGVLVFLGRVDDQVKISGQRVEPAESAHALASHPDLREATIVAREDVPGHKHLVGYAVPRPGAEPEPEGLREHVASRLPAFMVPSSVLLLDALPRNERGKIDRSALPAPGADGANAPASSPRVEAVAGLMAEILHLDSVGPDQNFFALGGSSLLAIQLIGQLRDRLQIEADIDSVFEAPTAAALVDRLESGMGARAGLEPLRAGPRASVAPLSAAQQRAWLFGRLRPDSLAYQFSVAYRFEGELDEEALRGAMGDLIERHEILRTTFEERDGEPVQVIHAQRPLPLEVIDLRGEEGQRWPRLIRERVRARIDPGAAPLLRWTLLRLDERSWTLVQVEHHLIHDGWSFAVLVAELSELYSARVEGRDPELADPEIQFQDFARWERSVISTDSVRRQLEHWRLVLDSNPPLLELPTDRPRPQRESFTGGSIRRRLEPGLAKELRAMALESNATLFMITLAAFFAQLRFYTSRDDLQVGSGLANRRDPASERLIGMVLNTVALRCRLGGDPTVRELLERVRRAALDAYANADAPFDSVVETLQPPRDPRRSPLIQTLFSFHDAPRAEERWSGLAVELVQTIPNGTAKADLNVIGINDQDGGVTFVWEHSDLFTDATADRLAGHHLRLLEEFVADPDARLSQLGLLEDSEQRQIEDWGTGPSDYDRESTVPALVERQALRNGGETAIVEGDRRITYAEVLTRARAVAGTLRERGVEPGDRVAVLSPRSAAAVAAYLGVLEAGATYVPLDPHHPARRIERALEDAGVRIGLHDAGHGDRLPAGVEALSFDEAESGTPIEAGVAGPEDVAYVMYTSGSTGEPKGVEVTHRNIVRLVDDPDYVDLGPGTVMLHAASPAFDATTLELWGPLGNGGTVAILGEQPSPDAVAAAISRYGVTTLWLTAGLFHELVDARPESLGSVRHLLAGGDVLSPHHVVRALAALPADGRLTNGYGPTETTTFALTHEVRRGEPLSGSIPIGRPIQGTTCELLDAEGRRVPIGVPGELWIGGDGVARGYRGDPDLTAVRFVPDPAHPGARRYRSGDRARWRPDGTLEFLDRVDRQVKIRGIRVEPAEVEEALLSHPGIAATSVVPFERAPGDLALAAYIVAADGSDAPDRAELRQHAVDRLPAAMVPTAWVSLPRLPLNPNGKVDRDSLPAPGPEHLATTGGSPPANRSERLVVEAFEKALRVAPVGVEDDFFALGGHSLLAISLFAELEQIGGRRLPLATIFEASTPRALAAYLGDDVPASRWDNLVPLKPGGSRPPMFVVSAGDGNLVGFGPLARHLSAEQPLFGLQPSGLDGHHPLDRGIDAMAERYLEKIREVRPHGPYLLAGRCNGATVAYEMAQRLRDEGEEVPLLVSLDSDPPPAGPFELRPGVPFDPVMESAVIRSREAGESVPDPSSEEGAAALVEWLRAPVGPGVSRYLHELWLWREDLRRGWPDPLGRDGAGLATWSWVYGQYDHVPPALLLPANTVSCRLPGGLSWDWAMTTAWEKLGREPADPMTEDGWTRFRERLLEPVGESGVNRYLLSAWERPDLRDAFPQPLAEAAGPLIDWGWIHGTGEGLTPALLPAARGPLPRRVRIDLAKCRVQRPVARGRAAATRRARAIAEEARARAIEEIERRLDRPLPRARARIERRVIAAAREARASYRARPWDGRVALIVSTEFADKPTYPAWSERARGGVEVRPVPVGHVEMLRDPGVGTLAACLEDLITEALSD